jgi:Flp pilus assembly protein TadG
MIKKFNSKKGQLFTILSILLIGLMFLSFEIFSYFHQNQSVKMRVSTMNSFLNSIETNLQRQMYISGFRIFFVAEDYISTTGNYINITNFFNSGFFNGTVAGSVNPILTGVTYSDIINSVNSKGAKINVNITMTNSTITISQDDPWHVKFTMISDFTMTDREQLASWQKKQNISVLIPVEGFVDPIYTIGTGGQYLRTIDKTIYEGNYVNGGNTVNLSDHLDSGYYSANPSAPSFLKRLEGNFSPDPNGIESFVRITDVTSLSAKSVVDYIYFSSSNPSFSCVSGMPSWFRIDDAHFSKYQVNGSLVSC